MTSRINSYPTSASLPAASEAATPAVRAQTRDAQPSALAASASASEAVTITDSARATAQLLDQARAADGIDHTAVTQLKAAVQSGSYAVPADALAASITSALAEVKP